MFKYIIKRILSLIPVILGTTLIVFLILNVAKGDPAKVMLGQEATQEQVDALREELGLNDPVLLQYGRYMVNLLRGDMGISYKTGTSVAAEIGARFPYTLVLAFVAISVSVLLAIPLGIVAAIKQNSIFDGLSMVVSLIGVSMPGFWMGLLLIIGFSLKLGWFPSFGADEWRSIVLPAATIAFLSMASIARTMRSSMLEVVRQDYVRTARAKGLNEWQVIRRHALRNAMIPTVTAIGLQFGIQMGGSVLTETVFSWPGIGRLMITSIQSRDIPMVLGCIIVFAICFAVVNLLVDLLYGFIDPRMKSQYG